MAHANAAHTLHRMLTPKVTRVGQLPTAHPASGGATQPR
jgi:hypothetical protein